MITTMTACCRYYLSISMLYIATAATAGGDTLKYPVAPVDNSKDTFGTIAIADPFRPLETASAARAQWLMDEKVLTDTYFGQESRRSQLEDDYTMLGSYSSNVPRPSGPYYLERYLENGIQAIYTKRYLHDEDPMPLIRAPQIAPNLKVIGNVTISKDGSYAAFEYSGNGSDWTEIAVYDIHKRKFLPDHITNVRYGSVTWREDGFYYQQYDTIDAAGRYTAVSYNQKLYYHPLGYADDILVWADPQAPLAHFSVSVSDDERFVLFTEVESSSGKQIYRLKDLVTDSPMLVYTLGEEQTLSLLGSSGDSVYVLRRSKTDYNGSILRIDVRDPRHWTSLLDNQKDYRIKDAAYAHGKFLLVMAHEFQEVLVSLTDGGDDLKTIKSPAGGSVSIMGYAAKEDGFILALSYFICPPIGEIFHLKKGDVEIIDKTRILFDPTKYEFISDHYRSADSTLVPIFIIQNRRYKDKPTHAALLEVYGGFGITPAMSYDPGLLIFLNNGGVFAFANVRGGANSVKDWHKDGSLLKKQNTFDDTYYAARYLLEHGYAEKGKLALTGGSNGGLVAAAVINQHPDCFRAAILNVGVYDMIRAERFTVGAFHIREFGTVAKEAELLNLRSYSPLHNVKPHTQYPSMLIRTGEYDDRVPPLHSYKYVAALQQLTESTNPILLRVVPNAGHHTGADFGQRTTLNMESYSFLFKELGLKYKAGSSYW